MLIAGAKGHAKEVLELYLNEGVVKELFFFDDISLNIDAKLYNIFPIIRSIEEASTYFNKIDPNFLLGIGNPKLRLNLANKLKKHGGVLNSIISKYSIIGTYNVQLGLGLNIMNNSMISNDVIVADGALINAYASIHHDVSIGMYSEVSPHAVLLGGVSIGDLTTIGSNATVLPKVKIGSNVVVGAGSVVTKDLPDNCIAVGVPAKIIKSNI